MIEEDALSDNAGIHLVPCTSAEEQANREQTVADGGLSIDDIPDDVEESTRETLEREFDALLNAAGRAQDKSVQCWPIQESTWTQRSFAAGDLLLFFEGFRYDMAAVVTDVVTAPTLGETILETDADASTREYFLVLGGADPIDIHSRVIADYVGDDLDYIMSMTTLSIKDREEIIQDFEGITQFLRKAKEGISKRPPTPAVTSVDLTEPEPLSPIDPGRAKDSAPPETETSDSVEEVLTESAAPSSSEFIEESSDTEHELTSPEFIDDQIDIQLPTFDDVSPQAVPTEELQYLLQIVADQKLLILSGPKKTGKKETALRLAELLTEKDDRQEAKQSRVQPKNRIAVTNFRPQLSYDEFVLGRLSSDERSAPITGEFGSFCDLAAADTQQSLREDQGSLPSYILIIEDFQLADPMSVFGNFWQLLSPENRGRDHRISPMGTDVNLWVPEGLCIIGIVNTDDANTSLSPTVRRMFSLYDLTPNYGALAATYGITTPDEAVNPASEIQRNSILALQELNDRIRTAERLGPEYQLGERYLCAGGFEYEPLGDAELKAAWRTNILPDIAMHYSGGLAEVGNELLDDVPISLSKRTVRSDETIETVIQSLANYHHPSIESDETTK